MFNGRARDYHSVEAAVIYLTEGLIKFIKMMLRRVSSRIGLGGKERHSYLKR